MTQYIFIMRKTYTPGKEATNFEPNPNAKTTSHLPKSRILRALGY